MCKICNRIWAQAAERNRQKVINGGNMKEKATLTEDKYKVTINVSRHKEIDILVEGKLMLHIGQVSDKDCVNMFLYSDSSIEPLDDMKAHGVIAELLTDHPEAD